MGTRNQGRQLVEVRGLGVVRGKVALGSSTLSSLDSSNAGPLLLSKFLQLRPPGLSKLTFTNVQRMERFVFDRQYLMVAAECRELGILLWAPEAELSAMGTSSRPMVFPILFPRLPPPLSH